MYVCMCVCMYVCMYVCVLLQVVQGGPLPPVPNHIPVSSFSNKALLQSPVAVATRISYDEKVGFIWIVLVHCIYK